MVKLSFVNTPNDKLSSRPIGVLNALVVGFDRIAARPILILPPLFLDLFLWLGPQMRITSLIQTAAAALLGPLSGDPFFRERIEILREGLSLLAERFNLFAALSTTPVGIPSVMSGRMPLRSPLNQALQLEIPQLSAALALWVGMTILGLGLGGQYHRWVASRVANGGSLASGWTAWRRLVGLACMVYLGLFLAISVTLLVAAMAALVLPLIGVSIVFASYSFLFLLALYLAFTPHGIVRYRMGVLRAMLESATVVRWNLMSTVGFLLFAFGITWLTNQIWFLPQDESWFNILALVGHAFVSGTVLAASYAFYQGRREWLMRSGSPRRASAFGPGFSEPDKPDYEQ